MSTTNGARHLTDWIATFIDHTTNIHTPEIFRKWTAISVIAATLEQKVWLRTSRPLYPNLYTLIIAHPGVGKSRVINEGRAIYRALPEPLLAPISMTFASLVDALVASKRVIIRQPEGSIGYNSMYICADEMPVAQPLQTRVRELIQQSVSANLRGKLERLQLALCNESAESNVDKEWDEVNIQVNWNVPCVERDAIYCCWSPAGLDPHLGIILTLIWRT